MLVKVEPCDSGGSFEAAIVPRIRQALQEPSRLQVVVSCMVLYRLIRKEIVSEIIIVVYMGSI